VQELEVIREEHRDSLYVHLFLIHGPSVLTLALHRRADAPSAHLQHCSEPSPQASSYNVQYCPKHNTPFVSGTFAHNTADVPVIIACTKAVLMDGDTDLLSADASRMGGMMKGNHGRMGGIHRQDYGDTAHNLLECACHFLGFLKRFSSSWHGRRLKPR
jgi:hypothetical protein